MRTALCDWRGRLHLGLHGPPIHFPIGRCCGPLLLMKHIPRKRFGQHFLTDAGLIAEIVHCIAPQADDVMVEIGPGTGALTRPLTEVLNKLTVIELDRDLILRLKMHPKLKVVESDVLRVDFQALAAELQTPKMRVVGNLPYNISTPILFHLLDCVDLVQDQHFMLQKEVIDRMVAKPGNSTYGRISVMLQWRYEMENVLFVPPESFDPPPKVDSAIVRMIPRAEGEYAKINQPLMEELVKVAFSQKRKLVRHTLGKWLQEKNFVGEFNVQRRAEEIPVAEYVALAQQIHSQQNAAQA